MAFFNASIDEVLPARAQTVVESKSRKFARNRGSREGHGEFSDLGEGNGEVFVTGYDSMKESAEEFVGGSWLRREGFAEEELEAGEAVEGKVRDGVLGGKKVDTRGKGVAENDGVEVDTCGKGVAENITVQEENVDCEGSNSGDESLNNVHFDDSEEERDLGLGGGFSDIDKPVVKNINDEPEPSRKKNKLKKKKHRNVRVNGNILRNEGDPIDDGDQGREVRVTETFTPENVDRMHNMEEEYLSEELESCDESDCVENARPRIVSRVGRSTTYRVNTLVGRHTYGRVCGNNNAKAGWVAKAVVNRLKSNNKVTLKEVVEDIRTTYSTGITISRAFKARQIVRGVVEGDSSKQYTLLWSYSAELRRACVGNT
ncbi:hypothetical protein SESBI_10411 [Sesbania bispinosa]|nr:hypothetical protein SESBI_10411 [Sesbania bispinosa]